MLGFKKLQKSKSEEINIIQTFSIASRNLQQKKG
jgi:hypothetical protein